MGRAPRIDIEDGWYHVMNRGVARQETFLADEDRVEFGRLLGVGHERFGVEVHAYCLMPNHYHLLLHRKALDLTGVTSAADYRWSSHRAYLGHRRPAAWLRTDVVFAHFADVGTFSDFVETGVAAGSSWDSTIEPGMLASVIDLVIDEVHGSSERAPHGIARTVMLVIADRLGGPAADRVLASMGFANADAQLAAIRRARRRASSDPLIAGVADRVAELTYTWCLAPDVRRLSA